jgi:hypothetical protein
MDNRCNDQSGFVGSSKRVLYATRNSAGLDMLEELPLQQRTRNGDLVPIDARVDRREETAMEKQFSLSLQLLGPIAAVAFDRHLSSAVNQK